MDPFSAMIEFARAALLTAGLAKCETGGTVYFAGGGNRQAAPIVLVHGANDQAGTWAAVVPALIRERRVIAPDLPGHGESDPKSGPISMPAMLDALHSVIEKEGAQRVVLVGNSMGAWLSILYTLAHPDRVEALVLESGGGLAIPPGVPLTAVNREDALVVLRAVHGPDAAIADWAPDAFIALSKSESPLKRVLASNVFPFFIDARLGDIKVPTTIVWGAHDGVVTRAYVDKLHAGIAGAKMKVIEGAAHIPHLQQPERFVETVRDVF